MVSSVGSKGSNGNAPTSAIRVNISWMTVAALTPDASIELHEETRRRGLGRIGDVPTAL
jgi:hypothetical protein